MAGGSGFRAKWRRWTRVFRRSTPNPELNRVERHDRIRSLEESERWWRSDRPGMVIDWVENVEAIDDGEEHESDLGPASANGVPERDDSEEAAEEKIVNERKEKERKENERQENKVEAAPRRDKMTARGLYEKY